MKIPLRSYYQLLARYLTGRRRQMLLLAVLLVATLTIKLYNPQILRRFLDQVQAGDTTDLFTIAGWFFLLGFLEQLLQVGATYVGNDVAWRATNALRETLFSHVLHLNLTFHQNHSPGELIERIDGDVDALRHFFSRFVLLLLANLMLLIGVLVMLFRENLWIGLVFTLFAALALLVIARLRQATTTYWGQQREASGQFYGFVTEQLNGVDDIRANGALPFSEWQALKAERRYYRAGIRARLTADAILSAIGSLMATGQTAALALAAALFLQNTFSLGTVYLITYYIGLIILPIRILVFQIDDLQRAGASIQRVSDLLTEPVSDPAPAASDWPPQKPHHGPSGLTFANVTFGYERQNPILHNISFTLEPGESLGILGRTGSGKTTLSRLIFGFYQPASGQIRLDGVPLAQLPLATLRQKIGLVTQKVDLFAATIEQNLTLFAEGDDEQALVALLERLGLGEWLAGQPDGLATLLPAGGGLSAGEAQLLALARIFRQDPGLILLDEASARLDPLTEHKIERVLDELLAERTAVIIAHRLETIQRCDKVLILADGRVVEYGAQTALRARPDSRLNRLLRQGAREAAA